MLKNWFFCIVIRLISIIKSNQYPPINENVLENFCASLYRMNRIYSSEIIIKTNLQLKTCITVENGIPAIVVHKQQCREIIFSATVYVVNSLQMKF